jgi:hypothetical protein
LTKNLNDRKKEFSIFFGDERNLENVVRFVMSHVYTEELNLLNY